MTFKTTQSLPSNASFSNIINGHPRLSPKSHRAINPSTGELLWDVPVATKADVEDAISAARDAFKTWSKTPWEDRSSSLLKVREIITSHRDEFIHLIITEGGKPKHFAAAEVDLSAEFFSFHAQQTLPPEIIQEDDTVKITTSYHPRGIVAAITPWNFPLFIPVAKIAAALLTGNCIIVKPSPFTPYTMLRFVELATSILPPGVLQVVNGDDTTGPILTTHPGIDKITFTGSIETGKKVLAAASSTLKECTLELGSNDAAIVYPDVDVNSVAAKIAIGAFMNSGQVCIASKRIYVHEDVYRDFITAMVDTVREWKVGAANDDVMLGPLQNSMQLQKVTDIWGDCKKNGYKMVLEGGPRAGPGYLFDPVIVDNPPETSRIVTEEPFGPIVPVLPWRDEEDLIARVNNTDTGLGGSVWTPDLQKAQRMASRIETGSVWINSFANPLPQGYFSGWKASGVGGEWGRHGLRAYCNLQVQHVYK